MIEYIIIALLILISLIAFAQNSNGYNYVISEPKPGQYRTFYEKDGVTIYLSWIAIKGKTIGVNFKVINNNNYPVMVSWTGPQWYSKGICLLSVNQSSGAIIDQLHQPESLSPFAFVDDKGLANPQADEHGQLGYNCFCYDAPEGDWKPSQLTLKLVNLQVQPQSSFRLAGH